MHVRVPKPLHGWRAFGGEVGIIVLGVLIALGFGQLVEQWQWRQDLDTTRQALGNELAGAANEAAGRIAVEDCLRDRVTEVAARLNRTNGRWTADPLPLAPNDKPTPHWDNRSFARVYEVPLVGWSQDAWDTAKSSGALDHMSQQELASYSAIYGEIAGIRDLQIQELLLESKLSFLSTDQQLDNDSRVEALGTLGQLDALNSVIAGLSSLILDQVKVMRLHVDRSANAGAQEQIEGERKHRGACVKDVQVQF